MQRVGISPAATGASPPDQALARPSAIIALRAFFEGLPAHGRSCGFAVLLFSSDPLR